MSGEPAEDRAMEQWARDLLELAIKERLVRLPKATEWGGDPHPQARSAGELVAVADKLSELIEAHDRQLAACRGGQDVGAS